MAGNWKRNELLPVGNTLPKRSARDGLGVDASSHHCQAAGNEASKTEWLLSDEEH